MKSRAGGDFHLDKKTGFVGCGILKKVLSVLERQYGLSCDGALSGVSLGRQVIV